MKRLIIFESFTSGFQYIQSYQPNNTKPETESGNCLQENTCPDMCPDLKTTDLLGTTLNSAGALRRVRERHLAQSDSLNTNYV